MDSDAWFTNRTLSLHSMLNCYAPAMLSSSSNYSFLFSYDFAVVKKREGEVNAGVFVMRVNDDAKRFIQRWWDGADGEYRHLQGEWPFEQGVLNDVIMHSPLDLPLIHPPLPRGLLYGHASLYINHVTSYWTQQRGWQGRREQLMINDILHNDLLT